MSKTAQRKRAAYQNGYQVGRYGWPPGVTGFRVSKSADLEWHCGRRDGLRDRQAAEQITRSWRHRVVAWLRGLMR